MDDEPRLEAASSPRCRALGLAHRFRALFLTIASIFQAYCLLSAAFLLFPSDNEMLMLFRHQRRKRNQQPVILKHSTQLHFKNAQLIVAPDGRSQEK